MIRSQVVAEPAQGAGPSSGIAANSLSGVKEEEMLPAASSSYSSLNIFWTMFIFFLRGALDLDPDRGVHRHLPQSFYLSGHGPVVLVRTVHPAHRRAVHLIARGGSMQERAAGRAQR